MEVNTKWWSIIIVVIISLMAFLIINSQGEVAGIENCKAARIRAYPEKYFTWNGIVDLVNSKNYQPNCL